MLDEILAILTPGEMTMAGVTRGGWSVKDILAHLVEWQQMNLNWYAAGRLTFSVPEANKASERESFMTIAVCLKCGHMKFGAWTPCEKCKYQPEQLEERAKHLILSDHYYTPQELEKYAQRVAQGEKWFFDEQDTRNFVNELAEAERQEAVVRQSWDLVEEYRQDMGKDDLEFFDGLPEYSQAMTARLALYQQYSTRIEEANQRGGWTAAEAEFQKILAEDPRLKPLEIHRTREKDGDGWMVTHP